MIFVRKLVLACLINSTKYIFISYSAHIWIKKCFQGILYLGYMQVSTLKQLASANVHSSPTVIPDYHTGCIKKTATSEFPKKSTLF
jgi:hypothetical protein